MLGPVARRRHGDDPHLADLDRVAVAERLVLVLDAGVLGDVNRGTRRLAQPPAARHVVGVVVRLEDVGDLEAVVAGERKVVLDLPLGVDHHRLAAVGDHVRRAAEILVQYLSEEHGRTLPRRLTPHA